MRTKGEAVNHAFAVIGVSPITKPVQPDDMAIGISTLESMMAELEESSSLYIGFNFTEIPDSTDLLGVERKYQDMIKYQLAVSLSAVYEIPLNAVVAGRARSSIQSAYNATARERVFEYSNPRRMPIGSGNARWFSRFNRFYRDAPPPSASDKFIRRGDVADFYEDFTAYLTAGETIDSFEIKADVGLVIVSSDNRTPRIDYRLRGEPGTGNSIHRTVEIKITTSAGRVETRYPEFYLMAEEQIQTG